jgi:succinyl-CoA synthetase alpha subunit
MIFSSVSAYSNTAGSIGTSKVKSEKPVVHHLAAQEQRRIRKMGGMGSRIQAEERPPFQIWGLSYVKGTANGTATARGVTAKLARRAPGVSTGVR